jgi:hypothetical protein
MFLRWKKSLLLSTAVAARWMATKFARLAEKARRAADTLLPALFLALMIGSLFAGSYAVAHHLQVASR